MTLQDNLDAPRARSSRLTEPQVAGFGLQQRISPVKSGAMGICHLKQIPTVGLNGDGVNQSSGYLPDRSFVWNVSCRCLADEMVRFKFVADVERVWDVYGKAKCEARARQALIS